jgi:hypothetical protein
MTKVNYKKNYNQCSYFNDKLGVIEEVNRKKIKPILNILVSRGEHKMLSEPPPYHG